MTFLQNVILKLKSILASLWQYKGIRTFSCWVGQLGICFLPFNRTTSTCVTDMEPMGIPSFLRNYTNEYRIQQRTIGPQIAQQKQKNEADSFPQNPRPVFTGPVSLVVLTLVLCWLCESQPDDGPVKTGQGCAKADRLTDRPSENRPGLCEANQTRRPSENRPGDKKICECGFVARRPRHLLRHKKYNCPRKKANNANKPAQNESAGLSAEEQRVVSNLNNDVVEELITLELDETDVQALIQELGDIPNFEFL
ncbi:hypothetical protein HELRODRAFT_162848 [Helobdella robusta]|uniref:Uncharacterized protein n=1 Tax=Helobdella robusta TaxID=6412 RepID=T1ET96_HELRO|nr:hypothetical protein HELRODRAFT_162848 [Helobdella robusta]ESN99325.1 hypothetical protein HELRODRAFT_162848 [Helobdella robusta]